MRTCESRCPKGQDKGIEPPGAGETGSCGQHSAYAGNQTLVLCRGALSLRAIFPCLLPVFLMGYFFHYLNLSSF